MDFNPSEEQRMLADSVDRFVQSRYDLDKRRAYQVEPTSFSNENWNLLAELGLTALIVPEGDGGLGASRADVITVAQSLGRGLVVEPFLQSAVLAMRLMAACGRPANLAPLLAGEKRLAVAWADPPPDREPLRWQQTGETILLNGCKTFVIQAIGVEQFIALCLAPHDFAAFLMDSNQPGLERTDYRLVDGSIASEFRFSDVVVPADARLDLCLADWEEAKAWADLTACGEMVGILGRLLNETAEYLRTRRQFGVAIGSFQALQHKMARMLIDYEKGQALLSRAAATGDENDWARDTVACKTFLSRTALGIAEGCTQLHGGMGITDELFVGHALKKLLVLRA